MWLSVAVAASVCLILPDSSNAALAHGKNPYAYSPLSDWHGEKHGKLATSTAFGHLQQELEDKNQAFLAQRDRADRLESQIVSLKQEFASDRLEQEVVRLKQQLRRERSPADEEVEALKKQLATEEKEVGALKTQVEAAQVAEVASLKTQLEKDQESKQEVASLKDQLQLEKSKDRSLENTLNNVRLALAGGAIVSTTLEPRADSGGSKQVAVTQDLMPNAAVHLDNSSSDSQMTDTPDHAVHLHLSRSATKPPVQDAQSGTAPSDVDSPITNFSDAVSLHSEHLKSDAQRQKSSDAATALPPSPRSDENYRPPPAAAHLNQTEHIYNAVAAASASKDSVTEDDDEDDDDSASSNSSNGDSTFDNLEKELQSEDAKIADLDGDLQSALPESNIAGVSGISSPPEAPTSTIAPTAARSTTAAPTAPPSTPAARSTAPSTTAARTAAPSTAAVPTAAPSTAAVPTAAPSTTAARTAAPTSTASPMTSIEEDQEEDAVALSANTEQPDSSSSSATNSTNALSKGSSGDSSAEPDDNMFDSLEKQLKNEDSRISDLDTADKQDDANTAGEVDANLGTLAMPSAPVTPAEPSKDIVAALDSDQGDMSDEELLKQLSGKASAHA